MPLELVAVLAALTAISAGACASGGGGDGRLGEATQRRFERACEQSDAAAAHEEPPTVPDRAALAGFTTAVRARHEALLRDLRDEPATEREAALVGELFRRYETVLGALDDVVKTASDPAAPDEAVGAATVRLTESQRAFDAYAEAIGLDSCRLMRAR